MSSANTNLAANPDVRATGIGGSDISVVAGLNPFKSPYELYLEKRGELAHVAPVADRERDMRLMFGNLFEEPVAAAYCILRSKREGRDIKVQRRNETMRHPDVPHFMAHIDRKVVGETRGLECKNVGPWAWREHWGPDGSDQVPDYMLLQCQWYLGITGYELWDLAALHGGNDLRIYTIPRDEGIIQSLYDAGNLFWSGVEAGTPPNVAWESPAVTNILKRLYPMTDGSMVEGDAELQQWHEMRMRAIQHRDAYDAVAEGALNHIRLTMRGASALIFPDGSGYTRKLVERKAYTVEATAYMDMRFTKAVKK